MVNNVECPPTSFKRMYVCLNACKIGFNVGCRPFLGVDGCHLKGAYPGMCLVAVAMDGNNNLYPVAWAVVEVENAEVWCWFLRLLIEDLGKDEGNGLTIMSDQQKGLLDSFNIVTPKAEIRYCVGHNVKTCKSGPSQQGTTSSHPQQQTRDQQQQPQTEAHSQAEAHPRVAKKPKRFDSAWTTMVRDTIDARLSKRASEGHVLSEKFKQRYSMQLSQESVNDGNRATVSQLRRVLEFDA